MFLRPAALALCLLCGAGTASAEPLAPWDDEPFWERPNRTYRYNRQPAPAPNPMRDEQQGGEAVRDGGSKPYIAPQAPPVVRFTSATYSPGSIVIDSGGRKLYFVLPGGRAFQYPISVGREGFAWAGTEKISRKQAWPDWNPPAEMRQRDPKLPIRMTGGLRNPLGAMALYLGNSLYRIHGTNDEKTIGHASSSGCFRMMNSAVLHLAQFAQVGTSVTVVNSLPNATVPPPTPPVASRRLPPEPEAAPPARQPLPPVATRRPPEPAWPGSDDEYAADGRNEAARQRPAWDDDSEPPARPRASTRRADDVADVTVTPRDDYDPYVARRPVNARPYGRGRDNYPPSYADRYDGPDRGRVWYDDERDDY